MKRYLLFIFLLMGVAHSVSFSEAQTRGWKMLHMGNRYFNKGQYAEAERHYNEALKENPQDVRALFNLGDTYLAQNNVQGAMKMYAGAAKNESNKVIKAMSFHNMGYIYHKNNQLEEAIKYYKEALRNNPNDDDTRYNLALCQKQLKDKQQQQQSQSEQGQGKEEEQQPEEPEQNPQKQQTQGGMSNENTEQLLNLSRQSERETRERINNQPQPRRKQFPKNW